MSVKKLSMEPVFCSENFLYVITGRAQTLKIKRKRSKQQAEIEQRLQHVPSWLKGRAKIKDDRDKR